MVLIHIIIIIITTIIITIIITTITITITTTITITITITTRYRLTRNPSRARFIFDTIAAMWGVLSDAQLNSFSVRQCLPQFICVTLCSSLL